MPHLNVPVIAFFIRSMQNKIVSVRQTKKEKERESANERKIEIKRNRESENWVSRHTH